MTRMVLAAPTRDAPTTRVKGPKTGLRGPILFGIAVLLIGFGAFAAWSYLAPLASAAVAPGVVSVESKRKAVQHLEGGIVSEILVREGDRVEAGQPILRLNDTGSRARLEQLDAQEISAQARFDRLMAELEDADEIRFNDSIVERLDEAEVRDAAILQSRLFESRRAARFGEGKVLRSRISQARSQSDGFNARLAADTRRLSLANEQLAALEQLERKGHAPRMRVAEMEASVAELEGSIGDITARLAGTEKQIVETELEIINLETGFFREVAEELQRVKQELEEIREARIAAEDVLRRTTVIAPQSGTVVGLNVFTLGGVIGGGEKLMEIVPNEDALVVEAMIRPQDIDNISVGLPVEVRLTAFSFRTTPPVPGRLVHISADRVIDPKSSVASYFAKIELDEQALRDLEQISLYPGMPAEVMILLGERTFFDYVASPILQLLDGGMREP